MKLIYSTISILSLLFTLTAAQVPACATGCIAAAITNATTCSVNDLACQCTTANYALIEAAATNCVLTDCGQDAIKVLTAINAECASVLSSSYISATPAEATSAAAAAGGGSSSYMPAPTPASATVVPATSTDCGCGGRSTSSRYVGTLGASAMPSPTASSNGSITNTGPPVAYTGAASTVKAITGVGSFLGVGAMLVFAL